MQAAVAARHVVRRPHGARGRARRGDRRAHPGRPGAAGLLGHRGDDVGDPAGPRVHRPRGGREVRRLLPRARRRAAGLGRLGAGHASRCPALPGVPESSTALTLVLPYNDRAAVDKVFAEHGDRIACLVTEAAPGNMGVVPPEPGFNEFLAETCRAHGALFVSDEVMTGFRASRQGQWGLDGARRGLGAGPDDVRQGDGRRLPRRGLRRSCRRDGACWRRTGRSTRRAPCPGTRSPPPPAWPRSGWPPTTSTRTSARAADTITAAAAEALTAAGVPHTIQSAGTMFSVFFADGPVRDFDDASRTDAAAYAAFFHAMLDRGVYLPPSAYEAWFLSAAHDDRAVQTVLDALPARGPCGSGRHPRSLKHDHSGRRPTRSCTCCGTARCTTPTASSTGGATATTSPSSAARWPTGSRSPSATATSCTCGRRRWSARRRRRGRWPTARGLEIVTDERVIESSNIFEGERFGVGDGVLQASRRPGGTCGTRGSRRGASPTRRSWSG